MNVQHDAMGNSKQKDDLWLQTVSRNQYMRMTLKAAQYHIGHSSIIPEKGIAEGKH
jgi:tRNA A22 N-methylase